MAWKLGIEGTLYQGVAGATPSVALTGICGDLTLNLDPVEANSSVREVAFEFTRVVRFKASIEFEMMIDSANTGWTAILAAFVARSPLAFKLVGEGGVYFDADFSIAMKLGQPHEGNQTANVTIKPYYTAAHLPTMTAPAQGG